jgi:hypothetical protein
VRCVGGTWSVVTKQGQVKPDHGRTCAPHRVRQPSAAATAPKSSAAVALMPSLVSPVIAAHTVRRTGPRAIAHARGTAAGVSVCGATRRLCAPLHAVRAIRSGWRSARARVPNVSTSEYCRGVKVPTCPSGWVHSVAYLLSRAGDVHPRHPVRAEHDVQPTEVRDHPPGPPRLSSTALGFRCSAAQRSARRHAAPRGR